MMKVSQSDKDDVLLTISIEMERMFTVLSNYYSQPQESDRAAYLREVEKDLKKAFDLVKKGLAGKPSE